MGSKRKTAGEAREPVVVIAATTSVSHTRQRQRGTMGGMGLRLQARRDVLQQLAPQYQRAPSERKRELLEAFTQITGYHRKYAMWLLNHAEQGQPPVPQPRARHYGPDVQQALVQIWEHTNRICSKCLVPFLPTLLDTLERHGHLQLSQECRELLLSMSVATADRLLRPARGRGPSGISTTRAGTLLKQQIPIRTFQQWDQTQPGFLEVDAVAHCGTDLQGNYLYTLTLTDIATGWTECLPMLSKSQESVLEAVQQARARFPFPILGLDTDNGGEFINDVLLSYCDQEQITFTRGREYLKNDQCFVEQKNGHIVRQVVGYDRFAGVQAYQQLDELYRALRLYTNCFQPSLKLQGKQYDGRKVRLIYDHAKTPLQRLLLSHVLPASREHEFQEILQALDPVRLFEQVKDLQQALFVHATSVSPRSKETAVMPLRRFCVEACTTGSLASGMLIPKVTSESHQKGDALPSTDALLQWHRTCNDPFKEVWELIASWVLAHPERTSGEILRELQHLFPERYHLSHLRTLQRGLRKIRTRLRATVVVKWQQEQQEEGTLKDEPELAAPWQPEPQTSKADISGEAITLSPTQDSSEQQTPDAFPPHSAVQEETEPAPRMATSGEEPLVPVSHREPPPQCSPSQPAGSHTRAGRRRSSLTIEQAIEEYLEEQRKGKRRSKTLEWHQTALRLFQPIY